MQHTANLCSDSLLLALHLSHVAAGAGILRCQRLWCWQALSGPWRSLPSLTVYCCPYVACLAPDYLPPYTESQTQQGGGGFEYVAQISLYLQDQKRPGCRLNLLVLD